MDACQAFSAFVKRVLSRDRAERFSLLANSAKGRHKLLGSLDHDFERAIRANAKRGRVNRKVSCYVFHQATGFGVDFESVAVACDYLNPLDGWLIVASDGSAGIYRPESNSDATVEFA